MGELANRPLHVAATRNHGAVVGLLLTHNASVNFKNAYGNTPTALTTDAKITSWLKRVRDGGNGERQKLAVELSAQEQEAKTKLSAAKAQEEAE